MTEFLLAFAYLFGAMLDPAMFLPAFAVTYALRRKPRISRLPWAVAASVAAAVLLGIALDVGEARFMNGVVVHVFGGALWALIFIYTPKLWTKPSQWAKEG